MLSNSLFNAPGQSDLGAVGVRAADSTSNNLIEADDASSDADFLNKMGIALREVKESRAALIKLRLGNLDNSQKTADRELESEANSPRFSRQSF